MRNKSILLKSVICGLVYSILSLLIIFTVYIIDFSIDSGFILGLLCGVIIAIVTVCDTLKKTIITGLLGLVSALIAQLILYFTGIPYFFITQLFKDAEWFKEIGHLTVNEVIGYNWGVMLFWFGLLCSFVISVVCGIIIVARKRRN